MSLSYHREYDLLFELLDQHGCLQYTLWKGVQVSTLVSFHVSVISVALI